MNFKLFTLVILSVAAVALAGPAAKDVANKIDATQDAIAANIKTPAAETLKQWCQASQMSQPELTQSFKRLVSQLKQAEPSDELTEAVVFNGRLCQGAGNTEQGSNDMNSDDLVKDVYMDGLSACGNHKCMKQLIKCVESGKIDKVRANYFMTRLAVSDAQSAVDQKDMIQELSESFVQTEGQQQSLVNKAIQRQKMFAVTANLAKQIEKQMERGQNWEQVQPDLKQTVERVVRAINNRFIKPVTQQDLESYKQKSKFNAQIAEKFAERNAALKAIDNFPGHVIANIPDVQETLIQLVKNKEDLSTARQSAIEALEQNEKVKDLMADIALQQQDEPTEVRVAAYRCLMTTVFTGTKDDSKKQQEANEIVTKVLKHIENPQNQQEDEQFCLYCISHLYNLLTSENPDHAAIKDVIHANKQHLMQITLLNRKFSHKLNKIGKSSRNYQLSQTYEKLESGLIVEGDVVMGEHKRQEVSFLPKLVRLNVSLPILGKTVNVAEVSIRQSNMEEGFIQALRPLQDAKFNTETIEKVVGEFKQQVQQQQQNQQRMDTMLDAPEADISIKVHGCTIVYLCNADLYVDYTNQQQKDVHSRHTRSIRTTSAFEDILEQLKRNQLSFNRGFHFDFNQRLAGILDVESHLIGGLLLDSRINTHRGAKEFEVQIQMEPRISFEALVGPSASSKRILQRVSTKSALGLRLRYKQDDLVDFQIDLPMNDMELIKLETQMVEKDAASSNEYNKYSYLEDSIYGNEDIYSKNIFGNDNQWDDMKQTKDWNKSQIGMNRYRKNKRADWTSAKKSSTWNKLSSGNALYWQAETPDFVAHLTGLRSEINFVASPKDLTYLTSWTVKKVEPEMQGFRVQIQNVAQYQYLVTVSTPGSRADRTMQFRVMKQSDAQRTMLKTELQSRLMNGAALVELIHDGRQYAIKVETSSSRRTASSYKIEAGIQRSSQSGKIATTYKPYLLVQAPELVRPISIQGLISYQQSPKTVITYELKTQDSTKFIQGKYILGSRQSANKRPSWNRRSMQTPFELMLRDDVTMTNEIVYQWKEFALKQNIMIESEGNTYTVDIASKFNTRRAHKPEETRFTLRVNLDENKTSIRCENRCTLFPEHNLRFEGQWQSDMRQGMAKYVNKNNNWQAIVDLKSGDKKIEIVGDKDGRRVCAIQTRFNRQGEQYHFDAIAQGKNQPWAKISGKVPAMLLDTPFEFVSKMDHYNNNVIEFDGVVYKPKQGQISGRLDLQKNEMYITIKSRDQLVHELKARFDENSATLLLDAFFKRNGEAKAQARINMPGLLDAITYTKASSWKSQRPSWVASWTPSWMSQGRVEPSEIVYQSRNSQWKLKVVPHDELILAIQTPRLQHETRCNLDWSKVLKVKSYNTLDGRPCNVDLEVDIQRQVALGKTVTKQSQWQLAANWPQKKIDLTVDYDGVRVFSHQARLDRTDKFFNFDTNVDYYQQPYLTFSGKVPSAIVDEPSSIWMGRQTDASELNFGSKLTQAKIKIIPGNKLYAFFKRGDNQHEYNFDMQNGLGYNMNGQVHTRLGDFHFQADVNQQQSRAIVEVSYKNLAHRILIDWSQNKFEWISECDGRQIQTLQGSIVRVGDHYRFEAASQYRGQQWGKTEGKIPAMLIEEPIEFFKNIHRYQSAVIECTGTLYQHFQGQWVGKIDFANKSMYVNFEGKREHGVIKAKFDESTGNILAEANLKNADVKALAKINMPSWVALFNQQTGNRMVLPTWMGRSAAVDKTELTFQSSDKQLKLELEPRASLNLVYRCNWFSHKTRANWGENSNNVELKSETQWADGHWTTVKLAVDADNKLVVKAVDGKKVLDLVFDWDHKKAQCNYIVDGRHVIAQEARLVREGKFYTLNSQVEWNKQPFAHIKAKIPAMCIDDFSRVMKYGLESQDEAELSLESRDYQMKLKYVPGSELVAIATTPVVQHQSRIAQCQDGVYKLTCGQQWQDGSDYEIEAEINKPEDKSVFKAYNKPTGQSFVDWTLNRALFAY